MTIKEKEEVLSLITALFISKGKSMPDGTGPVWLADLQDYPIDQLRESFKIERRNGAHEWPTLGHVLEHLNNTPSEALEQFNLINRFRGWHPDIGWTENRTWNDVADRTMEELGGLGYFHSLDDRGMPFLKNKFLSHYAIVRDDFKIKHLEIENDVIETKRIE